MSENEPKSKQSLSTRNTEAANAANPAYDGSTADQAAVDSDGGNADVQSKMDEATEQGYFGTTSDPTPNENYTFLEQAKGAPTPETDSELAEEARKHQREM